MFHYHNKETIDDISMTQALIVYIIVYIFLNGNRVRWIVLILIISREILRLNGLQLYSNPFTLVLEVNYAKTTQ